MRLLFVHDRFGATGGAEVNLLLTASELKQRGHALGLLHGPGTGKAEDKWNATFNSRFSLASGVPAHGVRRDTKPAVEEALRAFRPDAIYVHKMADLPVLETLAACAVPVVRMVHDHDLYCLRSYKYFPLTRRICTRGAGWHCVAPCGGVLARSRNNGFFLQWRSYSQKQAEIRLNRRFDRMIVATQFMKQELLRNGFDAARIEVHAPVPRSDDDCIPSTFSDRNRIVYAGQIIRGKGVDVLIESLAKVQVTFECVVIGEGSHRARCEQLTRRLGLQERVRFTGFLGPELIRNEYADASVAVVSSVWPEPFGAVGLEAMRHGLPVVAFDAGGIREWLVDGYNGFLIPWMDRAQFAARVQQLLADKTLAKRLGGNGRQFVRERFGFDRYISGLEAMFERVTNQSGIPVPQ